ncbi:hypothetical protein ACFX1Q_019719 [Malus domestica]
MDGEAEVISARGRGSGIVASLVVQEKLNFNSNDEDYNLSILERRNSLLSQIQDVRRTQAVQHTGHKNHGGSYGQGLPTVAVFGYTNVGKSTLVSAISNNDMYIDSRLFATVDPKLRRNFLCAYSEYLIFWKKVLVSDTIRFISDLPLVEAFHVTLEEVVEANLLVHVLDCTAPNLDDHRSTVLQILEQIGISKEKLENMIEVWNKIEYEEDNVDFDECLVGGEDGEASNGM